MRLPTISSTDLPLANPMSTLAALLFQQPHIPNHHSLIHSLEHVVDRQRCTHSSRHGFHFNSRATKTAHSRHYPHSSMEVLILCGIKKIHVNLDSCNPDTRVTEWDYVWGFLCRHDARDSGDAEDVTFVTVYSLTLAEDLPWFRIGEVHETSCGCESFRDWFRGYLRHMDFLGGREMWKFMIRGSWKGNI